MVAACAEAPFVESTAESPPALETARQAAIPIPADAAFFSYRCGGANAADVLGDHVLGNRERDMVGDATFSAFSRAADASHVFFRLRVDSNPLMQNGMDLQPSSWDVLVDTDNNLRTYEYMLTADGNMSGTKVQWVRNSVPDPNNPADPAHDVPADLLRDFTPAADYYHVKPASDGSSFNGDADFFITLIIPKTVLTDAGISVSNNLVVWGGTNAQRYSLNADFGCSVGIPGTLANAAPEPGPLDPAGTPEAFPDTATTNEDTAVTTEVLSNDRGLRDTPLIVSIVTHSPNGTLVVNANNRVTFTPARNFHGTTTYAYQVTDADGHSHRAVVTVTVNSVNDPPTAADDEGSATEDSGPTAVEVLGNDSPGDAGEKLTVTDVTQPAQGGTVTLKAGEVSFTPAPDFNGTARFTYTVSDGNGGRATAKVALTVTPVNDPPTGMADTFPVPANSGVATLDVLANDSIAPDASETLTVSAVDPPANGGTVSIGSNGANVEFTPSPGFVGTVTFTYTVSDGNGGSTDVTVRVNVAPLDSDGDGLIDDDEVRNGTDPNNPDTDGGGVNDRDEVDAGRDPLNYTDDLVTGGHGCASTGTGTLLPLLLLLLAALPRRRQLLRFSGKAWGVLGLLAAVLVSAPVHAQSADQASKDIDVQQFKPGPGWRDVLGMQSPHVAKHLGWNLSVSFHYAKAPFNFLHPQTDEIIFEIVKNQYTFELMGAVALFDRFELGMALPITSQGSASTASVAQMLAYRVDATSVGDLRLVPKVHLLSLDNGVRLGMAVPVLLPTSGGEEFMGRSSLAFFPRVLGEWTSGGGVRVLAHLGINFQPHEQFYNLKIRNELAYGLGAEVPFNVGPHRLAAEATLMGSRGLKEANTEERPLELLVAMKYRFTDSLAAHLGGGSGLTRGYGTPGFRLLAGISWNGTGEAISARIDSPSPQEWPPGAEDFDGFQDRAGLDEDGDGILDDNDRCPDQLETKNGFEDTDGCADELPRPQRVDSDGDRVPDDKDSCPQFPEDKDGFQDEDGCSDPDNDQDGVLDRLDRCPAEPETLNGVKDEDGCPDQSQDKVRTRGGAR
jgi:uncharacterized protein (TIGR03382 family)